MDIITAKQIKERSLAAVAELDGIVSDIRTKCSPEEFQEIRLRVAHTIGFVVTNLLEPVLQQHPEIDDLK